MNLWEWPVFWDDLARIGAAALSRRRDRPRTGMARPLGRLAHAHDGRDRRCDLCHRRNGGRTARTSTVPSRVIQGVASGIGFLGAGTILKLGDKMQIKGLTTASSIWLAAALGIAAGLAEYLVGDGVGRDFACSCSACWGRSRKLWSAGTSCARSTITNESDDVYQRAAYERESKRSTAARYL